MCTVNTLKVIGFFKEPCAQGQDKTLRFYIPEIVWRMKIACLYFPGTPIRQKADPMT